MVQGFWGIAFWGFWVFGLWWFSAGDWGVGVDFGFLHLESRSP